MTGNDGVAGILVREGIRMDTIKPRVLVVEDEPTLAEGLAEALRFQGYECDVATDGAAGLAAARKGAYDVMLLDIMMPEMSGFEVIEALRSEGSKLPTIMLTAKGAEDDKVHGLELGADDYVTKPFAIRELIARVGAQVRRMRMGRGDGDTFVVDDVTFDLGRLIAHRGEEEIPLTPREGEILSYLSVMTHYDSFEKGLLDSSDALFFLSFIFFT